MCRCDSNCFSRLYPIDIVKKKVFFRNYHNKGKEISVQNWAQLPIQQGQVRIYNQGAEWGSVEGKLLRENFGGEGRFWLNTQFLLKASQGGHISPRV